MTSTDFLNYYWHQYIMLEKEFLATEQYVKIDPANYKTFSDAYAKLLLQIGSEIDVAAKMLCQIIDSTFNGDKIDCYRDILSANTDFLSTEIAVLNRSIVLKPWERWITASTNKPNPFWWTAYNKVKHQRTDTVEIDGISQDSFRFANLEYTMNALAGLYQVDMYAYYLLSNAESLKRNVPLPGSRLFNPSGTIWDNMDFPFDFALTIDNGCLIMESSDFAY